jgi:hypothetical protein
MATAQEGGVGSASCPGLSLPAGKDPVPIVQEAGWAPGPVWTGAENLAPIGIQSLDRPARSQSLCRLRYLAHITQHKKVKCTIVRALRLCTGRTAHRGSRGIALLFHDQRH